MKVCTDACLFGAWIAERMQHSTIKNSLDIGCGTGLLSLMLAQKVNSETDAIEINVNAAVQSSENITQSPWAKNISVINTSLQDFIPSKKYDLIICNPPFYEDDLRSGDENKNAAKHDTTLKLSELILFVQQWLDEDGCFAVLLPFQRTAYVEKIANEHDLFVQKKLLIRQSPTHDFFRSVLLLSKKRTTIKLFELIIHDEERKYTSNFHELLKDYYLAL